MIKSSKATLSIIDLKRALETLKRKNVNCGIDNYDFLWVLPQVLRRKFPAAIKQVVQNYLKMGVRVKVITNKRIKWL